MGKFGYDFYFKIGEEVLTLPITPSSLKMKIGSNNKVVTLINEGDINILKSPSLAEFEFDARFPMRKYPYSRDALNFETYLNKFTALKTDKKPFVFNVVRSTPNGKGTWATVRRVTLEDLEIEEDADEGDDVIVSFSLKEYKEYGVKTLKSPDSKPTTTSTSEQPRSTDNKASDPVTYVVKPGDCLWSIAKWAYGDGSKWTGIYEANKAVIEAAARKNGRQSSKGGHWIYVGTVLILPGLDKLPTSGQSSGGSGGNTTKKKVTLTIMDMGNKAYWGTYDVYVNNSYYRGGNANNYTVTLNSGDNVKISPKAVKDGGYVISNPSFVITKDTTVVINWFEKTSEAKATIPQYYCQFNYYNSDYSKYIQSTTISYTLNDSPRSLTFTGMTHTPIKVDEKSSITVYFNKKSGVNVSVSATNNNGGWKVNNTSATVVTVNANAYLTVKVTPIK